MAQPGSMNCRLEGRSNSLAGLLALIYPRVPSRLKAVARNWMARLEGGEMLSSSLRRVMTRCHGIDVGMHSYGCFDPIRFSNCTVGRYVSCGPGVRVFRRNHPSDRISLHPYFYNTQLGFADAETMPPTPLHISDDVWIGANALLLPGCRRIGRGAVVGAGAIVTRDVPDYAIVVGNPARVIRQRFPADVQTSLQETNWWLRPPDAVAAVLPLMQQPVTSDLALDFKKRIANSNV